MQELEAQVASFMLDYWKAGKLMRVPFGCEFKARDKFCDLVRDRGITAMNLIGPDGATIIQMVQTAPVPVAQAA